MTRRFVCYFWFVAWDCISLGFHVCLSGPHIEIHLPFGFVKIGWDNRYWGKKAWNYDDIQWRQFGWPPR